MNNQKNHQVRPRVQAVVLNWNGGSINLTCLEALLACGYPGLEVLFVDNGSRDGSPEAVEARFPQVRLIRLGENLGFTGGNNHGLRRAFDDGADMILILNNDVAVSSGFLEPLVRVLQEAPGVAGPKILDPGGRVWCAGGFVAFHQNLTRLRGFGEKDNSRYGSVEAVDYMPACCLLVSREVFEKTGFLNDDYFCYLEDVDFCLRARKAGFSVTYCPEARVVHHFSHTSGGGYTPARKYMNALNSVRFLREHGTFKSWTAFFLLDVLTLPAVFGVRLLQGKARGVWAKGRGILHGLTGARVKPEALKSYFASKEKGR